MRSASQRAIDAVGLDLKIGPGLATGRMIVAGDLLDRYRLVEPIGHAGQPFGGPYREVVVNRPDGDLRMIAEATKVVIENGRATGVEVADGATIKAFSHIEGATIATKAVIGPFARLRPGAQAGALRRLGRAIRRDDGRFVRIEIPGVGMPASSSGAWTTRIPIPNPACSAAPKGRARV